MFISNPSSIISYFTQDVNYASCVILHPGALVPNMLAVIYCLTLCMHCVIIWFSKLEHTMERLNKSQQLLIRVNAVSFRTTAAMVRSGVGSTSSFNLAAIAALEALEQIRDQKVKPGGILGSWYGYQVQLDIC